MGVDNIAAHGSEDVAPRDGVLGKVHDHAKFGQDSGAKDEIMAASSIVFDGCCNNNGAMVGEVGEADFESCSLLDIDSGVLA